MRIVLISTPIGFLGSGKGGGVELTLNSLVSGLISLGHSIEVVAPKNSKLHESKRRSVEFSTSNFSGTYAKEVEAYILEDKPKKVKNMIKKYCL